ncbi:cysteine synthase B [Lachnospiraceae bacterium]|nr:cysteine synthase B [Lachnospiraceae bacterium]
MLKEFYKYEIGNTPIIELPKIYGNRIILKLEMKNFLKSIKARTAYWMIKNLPSDIGSKTIVESSSGNLGYALGYFCAESGHRFLCLIDNSIAEWKRNRLIEAGIEYICVEQEAGYDLRSSRIRRAKQMMESGQYYWVNQYDNLFGIMAHEQTTGPEIWEQTAGKITHCICAMGSGGTIIGTGRYLKRMSQKVKIVGVEPFGSTIYGTIDAPYINAGTGLCGKPGNILRNNEIVDESFTIQDRESIECAIKLQNKFGINVGISTGMAYAGALRIAKKENNAVILVVAPDGGEAYEEYFTEFR